MGNNNGKGKATTAKHDVNDHDRAVLDLKVARDELKQYQKKTAVAMERHTQVARELLKKGDKKNALLVVKKKKIGEWGREGGYRPYLVQRLNVCVCVAQSMLDSTAAKLDNVQQLIDQIESAKLNVQIFESLKQGMMEREPFFFVLTRS